MTARPSTATLPVGGRHVRRNRDWRPLRRSRGYRVLLVDKAAFPSEIPQGHFIHRHGPPRLRRWGLLDRVIGTGSPPITSFFTDYGDFPLCGRNLVVDGIAAAYAPRRASLDNVLVDAAVQAGVELRQGFAVEDLIFDAGRVVGIRGRSRNGTPVSDYAALTIGADGRNSHVARVVHAAVHRGGSNGPVLVLLVLERRTWRRSRDLFARHVRHLRLSNQ
jgi:2-polyprenyl-6-methoxyphenol hydroxylase-like FAD-dependent oxidoreductase